MQHKKRGRGIDGGRNRNMCEREKERRNNDRGTDGKEQKERLCLRDIYRERGKREREEEGGRKGWWPIQ